ncbi:glycosyltransferase [Microbacterium rhizosphaerae]|uniref:glycosyltransferase n=1 Tax=Microbacterium rhizosphaerae TaxID=1678237 RepID=UPI0031ECE80F
MHVVFFGDQHLESLGGAQVSMRLQKTYLERAGHTVTVVAPRMHGRRAREARKDAAYLDLPSVPVTFDREYAMTWPGRRTDRWLDRAMAERPAVDVVHVQADFWGAFIGHRFAERHGLPVVHTMHNRVDVGIEATAPFPGLVMRMLNAWQRRAVRAEDGGTDGWAYLRRFAQHSAAVTAPSAHFADRLEQHGVSERVDVIWNGIDDRIRAEVLTAAPVRTSERPHILWLGRMSPEKRLLPFLEAVAESGIDADVELLGGGGQLRAAQRLVAKRRPAASVVFAGRMSYADTLRKIARADAVVQTSIGFETQGMTVFEAATLGTPAVVSDPDIGAELESGFWPVADASVSALASTLRTAVADIAAGRPLQPNPEVAHRFLQSSRTAAMIEVYERVLENR